MKKNNPKSELVKLQITELSVVVKKNCLHWNKAHALEDKPIKPYQINKWRLKNWKNEPTETRTKITKIFTT